LLIYNFFSSHSVSQIIYYGSFSHVSSTKSFHRGITPVVKSRLGTTTVVAGYALNIVGVK